MYEEADAKSDANLYVHHDIMLPAFPLAVAWLDCDPADARPFANMAAVGSYDTGIEVRHLRTQVHTPGWCHMHGRRVLN